MGRPKFRRGLGSKGVSPQRMLSALAESAGPEMRSDGYGRGEVIADFEKEIAVLLGKEAAVFMPSGTMCQQIALRIYADRKNCRNVAFHPTCHLEIHEEKAYQMLHNLHGVLVGNPNQLITQRDLEGVREPLAALLLELPQREIGGQLPMWDELTAQIEWAKSQGIATHLDGARLWESQPFYGRSYAEIASLFDTVYVSFYKALEGIAGAILTGPEDIIREARLWQRRHGGNLIALYPYVLSAKWGMERHLPRMAEYCRKAIEVADALRTIKGVFLLPDPPQTNMMHVYLPGVPEKLAAAALEVSKETDTNLLFHYGITALPGYSRFELSIGEAALEVDIPLSEIAQALAEVIKRAASHGKES